VLLAAGPDSGRTVGERIRAALAVPVALDAGVATVHASIGLATSADPGKHTAGSLLRDADLAMYLAKAQGGDQVVAYSDGMAEAARRRAQLLQDLALAVPAGQLEVHYQPTVRLADGRTTGFEALVRCTTRSAASFHRRSSSRWPRRPARSPRSAGGCSARRCGRGLPGPRWPRSRSGWR
jgi:predicted signal transduction protein with EAL and GGDEF domain